MRCRQESGVWGSHVNIKSKGEIMEGKLNQQPETSLEIDLRGKEKKTVEKT